jgi:TolB-like protein/DNA-binding winged helix-turn-helix (wHTH) protein/Tfp pilus assembly protein PilF
METAENKEVVYEFGQFVLDPSERTLYSGGIPIHLPAKEFDTLLILVEHNGKALSKEELMSAVWDESFVEEGNLAKQISRLRKLLETNGNKYIETIPKHGYRFSAEVAAVEPSGGQFTVIQRRKVQRVLVSVDEASKDRTLALPPERAAWQSTPNLIALFSALLALIAIGWYLFGSSARPKVSTAKIAVLPIRSISGDENAKILAAGLSDALIMKLGAIRELVVRPGSSVEQFDKEEYDPAEIGRRLDVGSVLEGSLLQTEGRLRVNLRLVDVETGRQVWADKFDGVVGDVFVLEDAISEKVARTISPTLTGERVTRKFTENAAAYDDFIKGRYFLAKRTEDGFNRAIEFFQAAAFKDPNYSLAYAGLADCYILLGVWGTQPPNEAFPKGAEAARHALTLDPNSNEALVSLAFVEWVNGWDFQQADRDFRKAIDLNPNYATAHHWYSYFLVSQKRNDEAFAQIAKARELEGPLTLSVNTDIGEIYLWAGRYDEAEKYLRDVLKIEPDHAVAHHVLGINLIKQGRIAEAIAEQETAKRLESEPRVLSALGFAYAVNGNKDKSYEQLIELEKMANEKYVSQFSRAVIFAGLGDRAAAVDCLEKAFAERSDTMAIVAVHPLLDSLRNEPRFIELERKIGYR